MKKTQLLKELKEKDSKVLSKEIVELTHKLAKLNLDAAMRKLKNVKEIQATRHTVARIWTILNERALAAAKTQSSEVTK
jgi:ribosomal protein L29